MTVFSKLNEDPLGVIGEFLSFEDFLQLCLTSKEIYSETKQIKFLELNKKYSLKFYEDKEFRNRVLSSIDDPSKKLSLDLNCCFNVRDVSALGGVHTLYLNNCVNVSDVSALGEVNILDLGRCNNVSDVSALGGVHSLNLYACQNVTDVSALGGVYTLNLGRCFNITNI